MSVIFYNIFLWLFRAGMHVAAPFHSKARKWVAGRNGLLNRIQQAIPSREKIIWIHCASLGEFEQGRPVMEQLKKTYPGYRILLTFFSPSGYEACKEYAGADWVFYLPADGPVTAKRFLEIVHPSLVIFVKYEFWYYYLKKMKYRGIPLLLISALFRKNMPFFRWYGSLQRKMLTRFDHLFVQTLESKKLVEEIGLGGITTVSGDTRFDRVIEIAASGGRLPLIESFIGKDKVLIAGSTWPEDEEILQKAYRDISNTGLKLIIAPHEIHEKQLASLLKLFPGALLYSRLSAGQQPAGNSRCLVIDNIGMLSRLYRYATITYVGGGLRPAGVHNVLEAAVYSRPVLFGPYYHEYMEAVELVKTGGGIPFRDEKKDGRMLQELIEALLINQEEYAFRAKAAGELVRSNQGATQIIMKYIQEKRLLTS